MIIESIQFSTNQVWAYNAILKYVVMGNALPNRGQRYNKICKCARKIAFSCVFLLGGLSPSTKQVADIRESRLARRESVEQRRRRFTRRTIASAPHNASVIGDSVERRIGSRVRGKYQMVIEWYRSGNEKESEKKQAEGRRKIR